MGGEIAIRQMLNNHLSFLLPTFAQKPHHTYAHAQAWQKYHRRGSRESELEIYPEALRRSESGN